MGKSKSDVVIEAAVHEALLKSDESKIGLIIGTVAENSEFHVAHVAETLEDEKGVKEDSSDEEQVEERKKSNFDTAQPNDLAFHAKQVIPMIPGGLTILGIYAVDSKDTIFTFGTEPRVKSMITAVVKGTQKTFSWYSGSFDEEKEMLFIHYNPKSKKCSGKIFEVGSLKSRPCDIVSRSLNWAKLECQFDTVGVMHVPKKDAGEPLKKNLQSLMKSFEESLNSAKFLINGHLPSTQVVFKEVAYDPELENSVDELDGEDLSEDETRDETSSQKRKNGEENPASTSSVHILFEKEPGILRCETPVDVNESSNGNRSVVEDEFINHLHMQGKISVIAFVPEGSSTACMADRLRNDIIRSMSSRIVMHCESLIDEESTTEPIHNSLVHHEIPRRVFVQIPNSNLLVSDYLFPGDGPKDCLLSFQDILSIDVENEDSIIIDKEPPFSSDTQIRGSVEELLSQADADMKFAVEGFGSRKLILALLVFAVLFLTLSLVIPYVFRMSPPSSDESSKEL